MITKLNLSSNQIGDQGVKYLAHALVDNIVRLYHFLHCFHCYLSFFTQILTSLILDNNQIGDQGAQNLTEALLKNTVR